MKNKNSKKFERYFLGRIVFSGVLSLLIFFSFPQKSEAFWGEFAQESYHFLLQKIYDNINGIILGTLKQQAVLALNEEINSLISGGSGSSARFITNWKDYLIEQPKNQAETILNDYLSQITQGAGSAVAYVSASAASSAEGFFTGEDPANYIGTLQEVGESVISQDDAVPQITFEGTPESMFSSGDFRKLETFWSGVNNPFGMEMYMESQKKQVEEDMKQIALGKAIANGGFIGTGEKADQNGEDRGDSEIIYPGALIKENIANVQDLGNKIIAAAQSAPEVISAVVSQMMTKLIQKGFDEARQAVQKQVDDVVNEVNSQINNAVGEIGPEAQYIYNQALQ